MLFAVRAFERARPRRATGRIAANPVRMSTAPRFPDPLIPDRAAHTFFSIDNV